MNLHGVPSRESNSGLPYSNPTHFQMSYAAPLNELRRTLMSYAGRIKSNPERDFDFAAVVYLAPSHPKLLSLGVLAIL